MRCVGVHKEMMCAPMSMVHAINVCRPRVLQKLFAYAYPHTPAGRVG